MNRTHKIGSSIAAGIAISVFLFAGNALAASMTVDSDTSVGVIGVYNKATSTSTYIDLSSSPLAAVLAAEPVSYPTAYATDALNSVWDTGTGLWFQNNAPSSHWIWETEHAEDPATTYASDDPLYDPDASTHGRVVSFEKTFTIPGAPDGAELHIAADNAYEVWVNGHEEYISTTAAGGAGWELTDLHQLDVTTSGWQTVGVVAIPAGDLVSGDNTIVIHAANEYFSGDDGNSPTPPYRAEPYYQYNPGAVIFHLAVSYTYAPTVATTLSAESVEAGTAVHDSAILSDASPDVTGTVAYNIYTDSACSVLADVQPADNVVNVGQDGSVPDSGDAILTAPGTYYWQAVYSGDENNLRAVSPCNSEVLVVTEPPACPSCCAGPVSVRNMNMSFVRDHTSASASTGGNYAGGGSAGNGGDAGPATNSGNSDSSTATSGNGGAGGLASAGSGGYVQTGDATSRSRTFNAINTNLSRVRR